MANSVFTFHLGWAEKACAFHWVLHFGKMLIVGVKFKASILVVSLPAATVAARLVRTLCNIYIIQTSSETWIDLWSLSVLRAMA